jgi:chromate reductase, NAD(P)H dehydrogenase (quinone)
VEKIDNQGASKMPTIVTISATSRPDNFTARALGIVNDELTLRDQAPVVFDARDLTLSFPGEPPTEDGVRLRDAIEKASGVVIATPEYHGGFSAMTKLIIENLGFPSILAGKPVALVGVAAGRIGAIKSLEQLRTVCAHTGALVLPGAVSIAGVHGAFDDDGNCTDEGVEKALRGLAEAMCEYIGHHVCPRYILEEMARGDGTPWTSSV